MNKTSSGFFPTKELATKLGAGQSKESPAENVGDKIFEKLADKLKRERRGTPTNLLLLQSLCQQVSNSFSKKQEGVLNRVMIQKIEDRVYKDFYHLARLPFSHTQIATPRASYLGYLSQNISKE